MMLRILLMLVTMTLPAAAAKGSPAAAVYSAVSTAAGCKIIKVHAPADSKADWSVTYDPSCTPAQLAAGNAAVAAFDLNGWVAAHQQ
jgi:hypothetical protein